MIAGLMSGCVVMTPAEGQAAQLVSHRAVYDTTVVPMTTGADIMAGKGRFVLEWQRECEGFSTKQRMVADYVPVAGPPFNQDVHVRLWENLAGSRMSFHTKHFVNGREMSLVSGKADGTGIQVEGKDLQAMPKNTLFPTAELAAVVDKAKAGVKFLSYWSFDGSEDGLSRRTVIVLGEGKDQAAVKAFPELKSKEAWRMRLAGHLEGEADQQALYEMAVTLYDNGISSHITYDYGSWQLKATLVELEVLAEPACD